MGKSSSIFSFCNIFKACFSSSNRDDTYSDDGGVYVRRRICPSDEDRGGWTAEPGIDGKASDFITRFYASHVSDPECQTFAV